jgi:hypothetical protein
VFIEIVSKKEKSSVRSDMSSTRAAPTELHFEGALDAIDRPRLWRSEASKLTHDQTFESVTAPSSPSDHAIHAPLPQGVALGLSLDKRPQTPRIYHIVGFSRSGMIYATISRQKEATDTCMRENQEVVSEEDGAVREEENCPETVRCDKQSQAIRFGTLFIRGPIRLRVSSGHSPDPTPG